LSIVFRDFVDEFFFNVKFDSVCFKENIFPAIDGFSDPTDRSFNASSSPDNGGAVENRHDTASFGNEID
jgi:hypothetical protein